MPTLALAFFSLVPAAQLPRSPAAELCAHELPSTTALTTGGLVWILDAGSTLPQFALGDRGGQVIAVMGDNRIRLFSAFDSHPPTPVWTSLPAAAGTDIVASSESDAYLNSQLRTAGVSSSVGVLRKFRSRTNVAEWRVGFSEQLFSTPTFDLSRYGRTIVSVFSNDTTFRVELRLHDLTTGQALQTHVLPVTGYSLLSDLSPDGTVVAFGFNNGAITTEVYEVGTWTHLGSLPGAILGNQAVSEGGAVVATFQGHPGLGLHVLIHARVTGGYQQVLDVPMPPGVEPRDIVVSDNGMTMAAGWWDSRVPRQGIVRAYDVPAATMTMERIDTGNSQDIIPGSLSIDSRGLRFAVGQYGNGSAPFPELAVYSPTSSTPLRAHPQGGAVFDVELSPDGKRYAASRSLGNRGFSQAFLELYEFGGEDLVVRGTPSIGAPITFELHGAAGAQAWLLRSFALAPTPIVVPGVGTLRLDPGSLTRTSMGIVPASGIATHTTIATTFPGMIGRTLWYQGLTTNPRTLSNDFVQVTIVP